MPQSFQVSIKGVSPYSQSKFVDKDEIPKLGKETADAYEKRTWQSRMHVDAKGVAFMPPMALKKAVEAASKYAGKIPGERNATYSKRFKSGVLVTESIDLFTANGKRATADDFDGEWLFLDAGGKAGQGGTRVKRCMPRLVNWSASAVIHVIDEVITLDVLERVLSDAGRFVGVGRFRPEVGGFYGRFILDSLEEV